MLYRAKLQYTSSLILTLKSKIKSLSTEKKPNEKILKSKNAVVIEETVEDKVEEATHKESTKVTLNIMKEKLQLLLKTRRRMKREYQDALLQEILLQSDEMQKNSAKFMRQVKDAKKTVIDFADITTVKVYKKNLEEKIVQKTFRSTENNKSEKNKAQPLTNKIMTRNFSLRQKNQNY